jgi:hypothetical protein
MCYSGRLLPQAELEFSLLLLGYQLYPGEVHLSTSCAELCGFHKSWWVQNNPRVFRTHSAVRCFGVLLFRRGNKKREREKETTH